MKNIYTTFDIGRICNVYPTTVINWVKEGKLKSFSTPGGHRRVTREDLLKFLEQYKFPLPPEFQEPSGLKRILVVDDDRDMGEFVKWSLEEEKELWEIEWVDNGFAAGIRVVEWQPDLMILDVLMPELDGYDVCKQLRVNPRTKDLPVIAFTCLSSEEHKKKILEAGATDYLSKPCHKSDLIKKAKKYLVHEYV